MAERRTIRTGSSRARHLLPLAVIWFLGCALLFGLVIQRQVPYDELLLDPNSLNKVPWYTGLVSNLGILGWTTATATAFFGSWVARYGQRPAASVMLGRGAILSAILLLDDLFQLHVAVKPLFGISKPMVYACYLAVAGWWVISQRREIARTRAELLLAAVAAFGASIVIDQAGGRIPALDSATVLLLEDASKFLGVLAWAQYFVLTSSDIVKSIVNQLRAGHRQTADRSSGVVTSDRFDQGRYDDQARSESDRRSGESAQSGAIGSDDYDGAIATAVKYSTRNRGR